MSVSFRQGLVNARSHIAMILGLLLAFSLIVFLQGWEGLRPPENLPRLKEHQDIPIPACAPLSQTEREWAAAAWRYFENNFQPKTGLVNSADGYPSTTLWDTASYLLALICAYRLELISHHTFDQRLTHALLSLDRLKLFEGLLPNKAYNSETLAMSGYNNTPSSKGIGWSAIDLARLLVPLHIIVWDYPEHSPEARKILRRWNWTALAEKGQLAGATVRSGKTVRVQEGRLGYEQYAARAAALLGLDMSVAADYHAFLRLRPQYGIDVPTDQRDASTLDAHNYVLSEPYILDGLEFGGGKLSGEFAWRVYLTQEKRWQATGILTAVNEDHLDQAPYFVYNTVFVNGEFWKAITDDGNDAEAFKTLSTKAAFGWHALYRTNYTAKLLEKIKNLHDPQRGWQAGVYEKNGQPNRSLNANTNAVVLESLAFMQNGPLIPLGKTGQPASQP